MEHTEDQKKELDFYAKGQLGIRTRARVFERKTNLTQAQVDEREAAYLAELDEEHQQLYKRGKFIVRSNV